MADEFDDHHQTNNICSGNGWDPSRNRFYCGGSSSTASTQINSSNIGSFGSWVARSDNNNIDSMDSAPVSGSSNSMFFQDHAHDKLQGADHDALQSFQAMDWNQALLRSGKPEGSFSSILQEDRHLITSNTNYQQETGMALSPQQRFQWKTQQKMFSGTGGGEEDRSINQELSVSNFQIDNSSIYECVIPAIMGSSHHQPQHDQSPFENHHRYMDYPNYVANYGTNTNEVLFPSKFSHFMRSTTSPPTQPVPPHSQLHFPNNALFWNASSTTTMSDHVPMSFLPNSLQQQSQFSTPREPTFDEKPIIKPNTSKVRNSSSVVKKSGSEVSMKRPRHETSSPSPASKATNEMKRERMSALQQLVSPFGKTDEASVLYEASECIKMLHERVAVLSTPYMKSGPSTQHHHQRSTKSKDFERPQQDLRSRGLCLVPISSTFPLTNHETTMDFWTPTFGGTFR